MGCVKLNSLGWSLTGSNVIFVNIDFTELIAAVSSTVLSRKKGKIIWNSRSLKLFHKNVIDYVHIFFNKKIPK